MTHLCYKQIFATGNPSCKSLTASNSGNKASFQFNPPPGRSPCRDLAGATLSPAVSIANRSNKPLPHSTA